MKIKTKEQYDSHYKRRGQAMGPKRRRSDRVDGNWAGDHSWKSKPNHKSRVPFPILDCFYANRPTKSGYTGDARVPMREGTPIVGDFKNCPNTLVKWFTFNDEDGKEVHIARAYPCVVHHGWEKSNGISLRYKHGKKGEHEDAHGRKW